MVCVRLIDNDKYPDPYCVELNNGHGFITLGEDIGNKDSLTC